MASVSSCNEVNKGGIDGGWGWGWGGKTANNVSFYFWVGMVETDVRGGKKKNILLLLAHFYTFCGLLLRIVRGERNPGSRFSFITKANSRMIFLITSLLLTDFFFLGKGGHMGKKQKTLILYELHITASSCVSGRGGWQEKRLPKKSYKACFLRGLGGFVGTTSEEGLAESFFIQKKVSKHFES